MCAKRGLRDGDGRSTDGGTVPTREVDTRTVVRAERRRAAFRGPRDEEKGRFPNKKQQSSKRLTDAQQRQLQGNQGDARSLPWLQLSVDRGHSLPIAAVDEFTNGPEAPRTLRVPLLKRVIGASSVSPEVAVKISV